MLFSNCKPEALAQLLDLTVNQLLDGILIVNDETREVIYFNEKFTSMWSIPGNIAHQGDDYALLNHVVEQVVDPTEFLKTIESLHGCDQPWNDEIRFKDGRVFARNSIVFPGPHSARSRVWIFTDITSQKDIHVDSLTGCLNRKAWDLIEANDRVLGCCRHKYCVAVVDLNDFKSINDDFGHEAGDRVLKRLGLTLHRLIRNNQDKVYRTGGDEFCLLFKSKEDISSSIHNRLSNELIAAGINAAVGVCMSSEQDGILEGFRKADAIMLSAKKSQKSRINDFIHPSQLASLRKTKTDDEIEILANLSVAIKKNELSLVYQPIFDQFGEVKWFEVLCRWVHDGQQVSPELFIPLSESSGMIHRIWDWVLEEAVKTVQLLKKEFKDISLALNFSAIQVEYYKNTGFSYAKQIKECCEKYKTSPKNIKIELTETSLLTDLCKAKELFDDLTRIGVDLCIDDFGTGFSSLSILQALPIKCIKIDGSFIVGLPTKLSNAAIAKGTISMANELGLEVCAECVETKEQMEFLIAHGCHLFQGYYKSKPISALEISGTILNNVQV